MPKEFDPEDPNELVGVAVPGGDSDQVLDGIVHEYLLMGWTALEIMMLFRSPYYGATHQLFREKGEDQVNGRIRDLAEQWNQGWLAGRGPGQPKGEKQDG